MLRYMLQSILGFLGNGDRFCNKLGVWVLVQRVRGEGDIYRGAFPSERGHRGPW